MVQLDEREARGPVVHVRFKGRSFDLPFRDLDVPPAPGDAVLKQALARYLELPLRELEGYVIERHESGNWTVRPEAVFG